MAEEFVATDTQDLSSFGTVFDPATLSRKGLCPVTQIQHKKRARSATVDAVDQSLNSHSLYYEIHGKGPEKLLFIMGLNSTSFGWQKQVECFSRLKNDDGSDKYTVLVFDNRGVGNSESPRGPYSTSAMAQDVSTLLDYVGWRRELHVMKISLGGMIALELASRIHDRIVSLALCVTSAGGWPWSNVPPWKGFTSLARLTFIKEVPDKVPLLLPMVFTEKWLQSPADGYDRPDVTNYQLQQSIIVGRAPITRPQPLIGALSQMCAGLTHHVGADRLARISASIPKIMILVGDEDHLIRMSNSEYLHTHMKEAEFVVMRETGHALHTQRPKEFNALIKRMTEEGRAIISSRNQ
ncbi:hypothetical protein FRC03_004973 [Tulasnella sp. 419]|nr:hypothetical protein FRC03_004973 [Tulasnella sp. 419]